MSNNIKSVSDPFLNTFELVVGDSLVSKWLSVGVVDHGKALVKPDFATALCLQGSKPCFALLKSANNTTNPSNTFHIPVRVL